MVKLSIPAAMAIVRTLPEPCSLREEEELPHTPTPQHIHTHIHIHIHMHIHMHIHLHLHLHIHIHIHIHIHMHMHIHMHIHLHLHLHLHMRTRTPHRLCEVSCLTQPPVAPRTKSPDSPGTCPFPLLPYFPRSCSFSASCSAQYRSTKRCVLVSQLLSLGCVHDATRAPSLPGRSLSPPADPRPLHAGCEPAPVAPPPPICPICLLCRSAATSRQWPSRSLA